MPGLEKRRLPGMAQTRLGGFGFRATASCLRPPARLVRCRAHPWALILAIARRSLGSNPPIPLIRKRGAQSGTSFSYRAGRIWLPGYGILPSPSSPPRSLPRPSLGAHPRYRSALTRFKSAQPSHKKKRCPKRHLFFLSGWADLVSSRAHPVHSFRPASVRLQRHPWRFFAAIAARSLGSNPPSPS